jgi:hypothetical protein
MKKNQTFNMNVLLSYNMFLMKGSTKYKRRFIFLVPQPYFDLQNLISHLSKEVSSHPYKTIKFFGAKITNKNATTI